MDRRRKLTKTVVDAAKPIRNADGTQRERRIWDAQQPGFFLRVLPSGTKAYAVSYGTGRRGATRRVTIGEHGAPWTVEKARREAERLRGQVRDGNDPAGQRAADRAIPTLREFAERYLEEFAEAHKKPGSVEADRGLLGLRAAPRRHFRVKRQPRTILDVLGDRRLDRITTTDITRLHLTWRDTPFRANRALALLSHVFTMARKWGTHPGPNPCQGVERFKEPKRKRYLGADELARLSEALSAAEKAGMAGKRQDEGAESPFAVAAIRLLTFTGCRKDEVSSLRWEQVDFERKVLILPDPKEGEQKEVPLNAPAQEILATLPRLEGNAHVFPGRIAGEPLTDLSHPCKRIMQRAGIENARLHDLRHSFASVAVAGGASLPVIGALLGHSRPETTARYAHLASDPLRSTSEAVGKRLAAAMKPPKRGRKTQLRRVR